MLLTSTYKPALVVKWTYKHGAKDEHILSCTEHIGPNDELKLSSLCVLCAAICVRAQLSMNSSQGPSMFRAATSVKAHVFSAA